MRSWRIVLRVYVLREEQRAMPAYEEPPVLPGGSFCIWKPRDSRVVQKSLSDKKNPNVLKWK